MGTIFDPDFDMYMRNPNCFKLDNKDTTNNIPPAAESDDHTSTLTIPDPTITTVLHADPTHGYHTHHTLIPHIDSDTTIHAERPTYTTYTTLDHNIKDVSYPVGGTSPTYHAYHPSDWSAENNDKVVYAHDSNPLYQFPMLYEPNYPAPNEAYYPGGYAQNVPTLEDRYKPGPPSASNSQSNPSHKPILGSGYGNGYSYGTPVALSTTRRPYDYRPSSMRPYERPSTGYDRPTYEDRYYNRDRYRPDYYPDRPYGYGYKNKDRDNNRPDDNTRQGTNRPSSTFSSSSPSGQSNSMYNPSRVGNSSSPTTSNNKTITTYFNPQDYYNCK